MPASNTHDCFTEFIGQTVVGVLFDALPLGRRDAREGTKTIVFDDGRGLLIHSNGSYFVVAAEDVSRAVKAREQELRAMENEIKGVLAVAGALSKEETRP